MQIIRCLGILRFRTQEQVVAFKNLSDILFTRRQHYYYLTNVKHQQYFVKKRHIPRLTICLSGSNKSSDRKAE